MVNYFGNLPYLDVLNGNVFSCNYLPDNDVHRAEYICGSLLLDTSMFLWIGISVAFLATFYYSSHSSKIKERFGRWKEETSQMQLLASDEMKERFQRTLQILTSLELLKKITVVITLLMLVIMILIYLPFKLGQCQMNGKKLIYACFSLLLDPSHPSIHLSWSIC